MQCLLYKKRILFNELSLHKKTNIIQNMKTNTKLLITFIVHQRAVVKQDHHFTHLLIYANTV